MKTLKYLIVLCALLGLAGDAWALSGQTGLGPGSSPTFTNLTANVNQVINVQAPPYNAACDVKWLSDSGTSVTASSATLAATSNPFKSTDCRSGSGCTGPVDKVVVIPATSSAGLTTRGASPTIRIFEHRGGVVYAANTISFTAPGTVSDSANGFGVLNAGEYIKISGAADSTNNGEFVILTEAAGTLTIGKLLVTTITSFVNAGSVGIAATPINSVTANLGSGATFMFATDDATAIGKAMTAAEAANAALLFPKQCYSSTTVKVAGSPVHIIGHGGWGTEFTPIAASSAIVSAANGPIVQFGNSTSTVDTASQGASIDNIAVIGWNDAGSSQDCVRVNNRGANSLNSYMARCGNRGIALWDSVGGNFNTVQIWQTSSDGFAGDPGLSSNSGAVVANNRYAGVYIDDAGGYGFYWNNGAASNQGHGGRVEQNNLGGVGLDSSVSGGTVYNKWTGGYSEQDPSVTGNSTGNVVVLSSSAHHNEINMTRFDTEPVYLATYYDNSVDGHDVTSGAFSSRLQKQFSILRSAGGASSSDYDHVDVMNQGATDHGAILAQYLGLTSGQTVATTAWPATLPTGGALNFFNGAALEFENAAGSGAINAFQVTSGDKIAMGSSLSSGTIDVGGRHFLCASSSCDATDIGIFKSGSSTLQMVTGQLAGNGLEVDIATAGNPPIIKPADQSGDTNVALNIVGVGAGLVNFGINSWTVIYSAAGTAVPTPASAYTHGRLCVSDSTLCTSGTTYVSGGGTACVLYSNGTNWIETGGGC